MSSNFPFLEELNLHGNPLIDLNDAMPDKDIDPNGYREFYPNQIKKENPRINILDGEQIWTFKDLNEIIN